MVTIPSDVTPRWLQGAGPAAGLGVALLALAAILFLPQVLNDGDTYWHLAAGEWMLAHRQVLHEDVFSYTWAGRPWQTHEWLSEVVMALAYRAGGWSGLLILAGAALSAALALIASRAGRFMGPLSLFVMLFLSLAVTAPSLLVRPHLLALPVVALWTRELLGARDANRSPSLWLAALMAVWANLHGSYVFGFVVMAPLALEALMAADDRWKVVRGWGLVGVLCLAAAFVTPHGLEGLLHPLKIMTMGKLNAIVEWRSANFSELTPFEMALLVAIFVCLSFGVRAPPLRLVLLLFVLHMALQHQRHQIVLAVIAPMLLAEPIGRALGAAPAAHRPGRRVRIAFLVLVALLVAGRLALPLMRTERQNAVFAAMAHVPPEVAARPVLNTYDYGGYLIFKGVRPFIDGRADMYGDAFVERYLRLMSGQQPDLDKALAEYGVAWTMLSPKEGLVRVLDARPGWRRVYANSFAVVHVREN